MADLYPSTLSCPAGVDNVLPANPSPSHVVQPPLMGTFELAVVGLTGSGVGAALSVPLVWRAPRQSPDVRLLGCGLLGLSAVAAIISGRVVGLLPATPAVSHVLNLVGLLSYPLIYLYIRQEAARPVRIHDAWWLWIPSCIYAAFIIGRAGLGADTRVSFPWLLPVMLSFTVLCAWNARWRSDHASTAPVPGRWIVVFFGVLNAAQIVRMLVRDAPFVPALVPAVVTVGFTALVGLIAWRSVRAGASAVTHRDKSQSRYARSAIDDATAERLLASIHGALSTGRLFADTSLTLGRLADAVNSTPHRVSEVINRHAGISFHDLLMQRRVADVKAQLLDPTNDRFTIEGIGASAGFGSRSAMYAAFRRIEGVTPKEMRERGREGGPVKRQ